MSTSENHPGDDTVSHEPTTTTGRHLEPVATTQILPVVASGPVRPALPGGREPAATTQILPVVTAAPTRRRRRRQRRKSACPRDSRPHAQETAGQLRDHWLGNHWL